MDTVKFVGGPKDGEDYPLTAARYVKVPDAKDMIHVIHSDGETGTLFGEHTYEMKCYAKGDFSDRKYQLEYIGYEKPVLRNGMRRLEFQP